jgi:hypothetical protein
MNVLGKTIAVVTGVALLGAIGVGAWFAYKGVVALFAGLDPQVATVTAIGCLVALIAAWGIARSMRAAIRQSKAMALREEKNATYQLFVDFWENLFLQGQARMDQLPKDLSEKLQLLERLLALYGGAAVIKEHTALRRLAQDKGAQHPDMKARLPEALVAIRRDLGADTPHNIPQELERLLLPALDAGRSTTVLAPTS